MYVAHQAKKQQPEIDPALKTFQMRRDTNPVKIWRQDVKSLILKSEGETFFR